MLIRRDMAAVAAREARLLASAKAVAVERINTTIGAVRSRYITALPGQDMIYLRKEEEARAWLAARSPDLADYPLLAAEAGVTAPDAYQLAQLWLNLSAQWVQLAAALERARMEAIGAVEAAGSAAEIDAVLGAMIGGLQ